MQYFTTSYSTGPGSWHSADLVPAARRRAAWQAQQLMPRMMGLPYRRLGRRSFPVSMRKGRGGVVGGGRPGGVRSGGGAVRGGASSAQGAFAQLIEEYKKAHDRANAANQSRYEAIRGGASDEEAAMGGYQGRYNKAMELANVAADQNYRNASAAAMQDLTSRGLRHSSEAGKAKFDAYERSQQIPLQTHMAASGDQLAFMERKNEPGPSMDQVVNLSMMAGARNANAQIPQQLAMIQQLMGRGGGSGGGFSQVVNRPYVAGLNVSGPGFMPFMFSGQRGYGQSNLPSQRRMNRRFNLRGNGNVNNIGGVGGGGVDGGLPRRPRLPGIEPDHQGFHHAGIAGQAGLDPAILKEIENHFGKQLTHDQMMSFQSFGIPIVTNPNAEGSKLKPGDYYVDKITRVVKRY